MVHGPVVGRQSIWRVDSFSVTVPRVRGSTLVNALKPVPRPGTLAKTPWGPRTIRPVRTSYLASCHGQTRFNQSDGQHYASSNNHSLGAISRTHESGSRHDAAPRKGASPKL